MATAIRKNANLPRSGVQPEVSLEPLARPGIPWTDFQMVRAVAHAGSVAKASHFLGMTHSTLLRKLSKIETRLQTRLFERADGRYTLTSAGHEIDQAAREFEPLARAAETRALGRDLQPDGEVRVSVASIVLNHLLAPVLAQFVSAFPAVRIELSTSREHASMRRREADVAIRIADAVPEWLVGRCLGVVDFKVYGRRRRARAPLCSVEVLAAERRWIGFERDARELKFDRWLTAQVPDKSIALRVDNFTHALAMLRTGLGIALLPAFLEESVPEMEALTAAIPELATGLWLLTHPELRDTSRVQVMMRAFGPVLANALRATQP